MLRIYLYCVFAECAKLQTKQKLNLQVLLYIIAQEKEASSIEAKTVETEYRKSSCISRTLNFEFVRRVSGIQRI